MPQIKILKSSGLQNTISTPLMEPFQPLHYNDTLNIILADDDNSVSYGDRHRAKFALADRKPHLE